MSKKTITSYFQPDNYKLIKAHCRLNDITFTDYFEGLFLESYSQRKKEYDTALKVHEKYNLTWLK